MLPLTATGERSNMTTRPALQTVSEAIRARRAERNFGPAELESEVLRAILDDARRAPSGHNLQPTQFVVVRGEQRAALARAALDQRQVAEAPVTVVIVADPRPDRSHGERVLAMDREAGAIDDAYRDSIARIVALTFRRGPLGLLGLAKGVLTACGTYLRPIPRFPAFSPREWAIKQALLAAGHLLLSATAHGVASCPMEGFDERRVRRLVGVPRSWPVPLIIPLGYPQDEDRDDTAPSRTRLPLDDLVHEGTWRSA